MIPEMKLYRLKIQPLSSWRTEWQADTLMGLLCWVIVRSEGEDVLKGVLRDFENGNPPFVFSDAFPLEYFPIPEIARFFVSSTTKKVKRARFITLSSFRNSQLGKELREDELLEDKFIHSEVIIHNTLSRLSDTTSTDGALFSTVDFFAFKEDFYLSVYARIRDDYIHKLKHWFELLSETGFGADISTGKGQFRLISEFEEFSYLDDVTLEKENEGLMVLSTFQPSHGDPIEGVWETFVKYGKVGPDFGTNEVFKIPLLMFRPGACFKSHQRKAFLGGMVPLTVGNKQIYQLCYGLAVPHFWKEVL